MWVGGSGNGGRNFSPHLDLTVIFEYAKTQKYTRNGEMFSVGDMKELAENLLHCRAMIVNTENENEVAGIIPSLMHGDQILVP